MATEEKKPRNPLSEFIDLLDNAKTLANLVAATSAALSFASGQRLLSYAFTLFLCFSLDLFLWRRVSRKPVAVTAIFVVTTVLIGWVSINAWVDLQKNQISIPQIRTAALPFIVILLIISAVFLLRLGRAVWIEVQKTEGILFPPARPGELLVVVGQFDQRGGAGIDPTTRIVERLKVEFPKANILNTRIEVGPKIGSEQAARRIGARHQAVFVIWGWYDAVGFSPHFTITRENPQPLVSAQLKEVPTELKDFNLYIREELPAQMAYFATFTVGQLYFWDKKYDEALPAFEEASQNIEDKPEGLSILYFDQGYIYAAKGSLDQALINYTKAIELDPTLPDAYNNRGNIYDDQKQYDLAIADYNRAIELRPDYVEAYNNRGNAYTGKGDHERAIADYNKAVELNPDYENAYYNRGIAHKEKGDFDRAIADNTKAIGLDPTDAYAYNNRGWAFYLKRNFDLAIPDFDKSIELDPKNENAYYNRGLAYAAKGDYEQAISAYSKALELDPADASLYYNRGAAYTFRHNLDRAVSDLTKTIEIDPKYANAYPVRGVIYRNEGLKSQAVADFETYLRLVPDASDRAQVEQWLGELKGE
jgi:tetratricopeptide (TPR) repeat protein